jgi:serine/threonine-protein kinase
MRRRRPIAALAACLAVVAIPLAGCGSKEPGIGKRDASELIRLLHKVQAASDDPQRCDELAADIADVRAKVRDLPSKVDADVRESLRNGVKNLDDSATAQCEKTKTTPTETTPTETTPTQTVPPVTTETAPPPTATTPPPPTATTPPPTNIPPIPTTPGTGGTGPGNGNGNGQGNANGQGKKGPKGKKGRTGKEKAGKGHGGKKR